MATATTRRKKTDVDAALRAVSETDIKKVLEQVGATQTSVQSTLAALGVTLSNKITELRDLETAIGARKDELKDIHDIEMRADTLDAIQTSVKEADEEASELIRQRRKEWQDDGEAREQTWRREGEAHAYTVKQLDERDAAECATQSTERQREERFRMEDVNKRLTDRVEAVDEREQTMEDLEKAVAGFDTKVAEAVTTAKAEVTKQLSAGFGHEKAMLRKDFEAAAALATAEKDSFSQQIAALRSQLKNAEEQLATAREDARAIATSAVEAASQRAALDTLQKSIETQASAGQGGARGR